MRMLVVCAVADEARAVVRRLGATTKTAIGPYQHAVTGRAGEVSFIVMVSGVGEAAAASATATALSLDPRIDLAISAGIAGGFSPRIAVGAVAIADHITAVDLGAEEPGSPGSRIPLSAMGYEGGHISCDAKLVRRAAALTNATVGAILTVSTITASEERIGDLARNHPTAVAEAMEGHGVAVAAAAHDRAFLELRTISNPVGVRDIATWSTTEALDSLTAASYALISSESSSRLLR